MRFASPRVVTGLSGIVAMLTTAPLAAHDFWIVPDAFQISPAGPLAVRMVTGTAFPTSESVVAADRIADARILGAAPAADEPLRDFAVSGKSLRIQHRPTTSGQRVVVAALVPSMRRMSSEGFARSLRLEGAADLADRNAREGTRPKQGTWEVSWATFVLFVGDTSSRPGQAGPSDSASAVAAVERFRAALARGDSATALAMLAPDAVIHESGDVETRAGYRSHHLPADIEFARAIPGTHTLKSVVVHGDAAWVSSTSITKGRMKGRTINSAGAELIVLSRRDRQSPWQIRAIHWSSHRRTS